MTISRRGSAARVAACAVLKRAMDVLGLMPTHFQNTRWATRKGGACLPRTDKHTLAFQFRPVQ